MALGDNFKEGADPTGDLLIQVETRLEVYNESLMRFLPAGQQRQFSVERQGNELLISFSDSGDDESQAALRIGPYNDTEFFLRDAHAPDSDISDHVGLPDDAFVAEIIEAIQHKYMPLVGQTALAAAQEQEDSSPAASSSSSGDVGPSSDPDAEFLRSLGISPD